MSSFSDLSQLVNARKLWMWREFHFWAEEFEECNFFVGLNFQTLGHWSGHVEVQLKAHKRIVASLIFFGMIA